MMPIVTISEAREAGLTRYFTGRPCPKGHVAHRNLSSRGCSVCQAGKTRRSRGDLSGAYAGPKGGRAWREATALVGPEPGTYLVPLTHGLVAVIDAESAPLIEGVNWYRMGHHGCGTYYAGSSRKSGAPRGSVLMHRLVMGALPGQMVDHKDRNGLNNRRCNLRFCDAAQNAANRDWGTGRYGFRGVIPARWGRWAAKITAYGVTTKIGVYDTREEAAAAYDRAALDAFGEFAVLNLPTDVLAILQGA